MTKVYKTFVYVAGIQIPFISASIGSQYGSLSNLSLEVNYSPYIAHIHEYSKVQVWEQIIEDGAINEPTLEFDGVVIGIFRNKNVLGNVSVRLSCLTDGMVWNKRKQYDFYINDITNVSTRGTDDVSNIRADGKIDNFIGGLLSKNRFDIGCAVASVFTSQNMAGEENGSIVKASYTYIYNGRKFNKTVNPNITNPKNVNPAYYDHFLKDYRLSTKLYGISTSTNVKQFFQTDKSMELLKNSSNDLVGENTFWSIALNVMQYGFYSVYDIPNPTYIKSTLNKNLKDDVYQGMSLDDFVEEVNSQPHSYPHKTTVVEGALITIDANDNQAMTSKRDFSGLAEYILKPISVLGLPLKCNIIWPEQVISESLFYNYSEMPTRILMQTTPITGLNGNNILLVSKMLAGPYIENCKDFFSCFTPPAGSTDYKKIRPSEIYSDYEAEYGMNYTQMRLSYAFEATVLKQELKDEEGTTEKVAEVAKRMNNFLNYEFAQRFFASRNYSVQVTPDVDIIPGLPVIVMHKNGEHIVCFCTGKTKSWSINSKSISINLTHPRYYYENIDQLGNLIDPTTQELLCCLELEELFGSKALLRDPNNKPTLKINSSQLKKKIEDLFYAYQDDNSIMDKPEYKRKVCTYANYKELYGEPTNTPKEMPNSYLQKLYASSNKANALSSHIFSVNAKEITDMPNQKIIKNHLDWIKEAQRI